MKKIFLFICMFVFLPQSISAKTLINYNDSKEKLIDYNFNLTKSNHYFSNYSSIDYLIENDYNISGGKNGYLFDGQEYFTDTINGDKVFIISSTDGLVSQSDRECGVRLSKTVKNNVELDSSTKGTYVSPWRLSTSIKYTLSFNANGGTPTPSSRKITVDKPYGELPVVTKTGYTFLGWFTKISDGNQIVSSTIVDVDNNITLYAHYNVNNYVVSFNANGGSVSVQNKTVTFSSSYGELPTPIRNGYTFSGWYTGTSSGVLINSSSVVSIASNHTLYARWTANKYTLSYNGNGGSTPVSRAVTYGKAYGTLGTTSRTGYKFIGWYTAASGGSIVTSSTIVSTASDHTLYARWTANQYTLSYNGNGGSTPAAKTVTFGSSYGTLATSNATGHTFDGWYTTASGGSKVTATTIVNTASNHTLFAHFNRNSYTLNLGRGTGVSSITATGCTTITAGVKYSCQYGASVIVTAYAASGYAINSTLTGSYISNKTNGAAFSMPVPTSGTTVSLTATAIVTAVTLNNKILTAETPQNDSGINFASSSGQGLFYTSNTSRTENGVRVYYYRGGVTNNNVVFGTFKTSTSYYSAGQKICWRIVRINEDGSTKLRFNGAYSGETCPQTGTLVSVGRSYYNEVDNNAQYAGYTIGNTRTNSSVKTVVDNWYASNLVANDTSVTNLIADTPYCNDRSFGMDGGITYYAGYIRIHKDKNQYTPQYKCPQKSDKYTVSTSKGNGLLTYPVGMITADEAAYAGQVSGQTNKSIYLYARADNWTMTPAFMNSVQIQILNLDDTGMFKNFTAGMIKTEVMPVISLVDGALVSSGNGSYTSPYIIKY